MNDTKEITVAKSPTMERIREQLQRELDNTDALVRMESDNLNREVPNLTMLQLEAIHRYAEAMARRVLARRAFEGCFPGKEFRGGL